MFKNHCCMICLFCIFLHIVEFLMFLQVRLIKIQSNMVLKKTSKKTESKLKRLKGLKTCIHSSVSSSWVLETTILSKSTVFLSRFFVDALFFLSKQSSTRQRSSTSFCSCVGTSFHVLEQAEFFKSQHKRGVQLASKERKR